MTRGQCDVWPSLMQGPMQYDVVNDVMCWVMLCGESCEVISDVMWCVEWCNAMWWVRWCELMWWIMWYDEWHDVISDVEWYQNGESHINYIELCITSLITSHHIIHHITSCHITHYITSLITSHNSSYHSSLHSWHITLHINHYNTCNVMCGLIWYTAQCNAW